MTDLPVPHTPKPKKEATRAMVVKVAAGWEFFPVDARKKIVKSVTSAIDAHHRLTRPQRVDEQPSNEANMALPNLPQRGRPPSLADVLVSRLGHIYAMHKQEPGTRSWDGEEASEFERLVQEVFQIAGIDKGAVAAVERHIKARNQLPDIETTRSDELDF